MGNYHLELFGWAWLPGVKTCWLCTWVTPDETEYALFQCGWYEGKPLLTIFNKRITGKKEI